MLVLEGVNESDWGEDPDPRTPWNSLPLDPSLRVKEYNIVSFVYYRYVLNKYSED